MSEMIERVARAIYESHKFVRPWESPVTVNMWHGPCNAEARAAIEAMREPTPAMIAAAQYTADPWIEAWPVMIAAALQETKP